MIRKDPSGLCWWLSADALVGYIIAMILLGILIWVGYAFGVYIERARCQGRTTTMELPQ